MKTAGPTRPAITPNVAQQQHQSALSSKMRQLIVAAALRRNPNLQSGPTSPLKRRKLTKAVALSTLARAAAKQVPLLSSTQKQEAPKKQGKPVVSLPLTSAPSKSAPSGRTKRPPVGELIEKVILYDAKTKSYRNARDLNEFYKALDEGRLKFRTSNGHINDYVHGDSHVMRVIDDTRIREFQALPKYAQNIAENLAHKSEQSGFKRTKSTLALAKEIAKTIPPSYYYDGPSEGIATSEFTDDLVAVLSEAGFESTANAYKLMQEGTYYSEERENPFSVHYNETLAESGAHSSPYQRVYGIVTGKGIGWNGHDSP